MSVSSQESNACIKPGKPSHIWVLEISIWPLFTIFWTVPTTWYYLFSILSQTSLKWKLHYIFWLWAYLFKGELKFENYLDILEDKDKFTLCRFRTRNHRLPVEVERWKKLLEKTGSVIYVQEENWETSITIFLNVLNLLMKENFILILSIEIDLISLNVITRCLLTLYILLSKLCKFIRIVNKRICPLGWSTSFHKLFNYVLHVFISCLYCVNCHLCTSVNWLWEIKIYNKGEG